MEPGARDGHVVECEGAEPAPPDGASLGVLREVQKAYERRMDLLDQMPCNKRMPMQVCVLKQWVCDLVEQNCLLARAVEELEADAATRLFVEQRRNSEVVSELRAEGAALRRRLARKDADLRGLVEVLRRLRDLDYCDLDGIHFFEVTESDIFGHCDWRPKKLAQGDLRSNFKQSSAKVQCNARGGCDT